MLENHLTLVTKLEWNSSSKPDHDKGFLKKIHHQFVTYLKIFDKFLDLPVFWWEIGIGFCSPFNCLLLFLTLSWTFTEWILCINGSFCFYSKNNMLKTLKLNQTNFLCRQSDNWILTAFQSTSFSEMMIDESNKISTPNFYIKTSPTLGQYKQSF